MNILWMYTLSMFGMCCDSACAVSAFHVFFFIYFLFNRDTAIQRIAEQATDVMLLEYIANANFRLITGWTFKQHEKQNIKNDQIKYTYTSIKV